MKHQVVPFKKKIVILKKDMTVEETADHDNFFIDKLEAVLGKESKVRRELVELYFKGMTKKRRNAYFNRLVGFI